MTYLVEVTAVQSAVREYLVHESSEIAQHVEQIIAAVPPALAAVPADLKERAETIISALQTHGSGFHVDDDLQRWIIPTTDLITALLARIAAQEVQIKGLQSDNDVLKSVRDMLGGYWNDATARAKAADTALAAMTQERDELEAERRRAVNEAENLRHYRDSHIKAEEALAAERAKVAKLVEAVQIAKSIFDTPIARRRLGIDPNTDERLIEFRAAITEAGQ